MSQRVIVSDLLGLLVIGCAAGVVLAALRWMQVISSPWSVWLIALPFLVGTALWLWHVNKRTREMDSEKWGAAVLFTLIIGAIFFAIDVLVGGSNGTSRNFIEAAAHAGSPMGFPLTVLICPIGTTVALGSWVRCHLNSTAGADTPES